MKESAFAEPPMIQNNLYAGLPKRFAAYLIDSIIVTLLTGIVIMLVIILPYVSGFMQEAPSGIFVYLLGFTTGWLYYAGLESSTYQATLGKLLFGIKVTDLAGNPISLEIATRRHLAKFLSGILLGVGYLMIATTEKEQGLHDKLTGCLVINRR